MVNCCFCSNCPLAAVVHQLQDFACAASAVAARWGIVGPRQVLPAGLSSEPPEMPWVHLRPGGYRGCRTFSLGTGDSHFTCSCFGVGPCPMSPVGGGTQFCCRHSQCPKNHTQPRRCDRSEGQAKPPLAISGAPAPKALHSKFRVISRLV